MSPRRKPSPPASEQGGRRRADSELRIIGGDLRGRRLHYHGDPRTRPMKHRVREAIFNLISTESSGKHVVDLFAGTGALGLEALSRGASQAILIEQHVPTARIVADNVAVLGLQDRVHVATTSAFLWAKRDLANAHSNQPRNVPHPDQPWLVFCSPPYDFYVERRDELVELVDVILTRAPAGSVVVVEADDRFDFALLRQDYGPWAVRRYPPAVVGVCRLAIG